MHAADASELDRAAVRQFLQRLGETWQDRRYDELTECFDERVVFAAPGFQARLEGRGPCVDSYREFLERAQITEYRQGEAYVQVWGDTAVADYAWTMAWTSGGSPHRESGHDVFVCKRAADTPDGWRAVWRTITVDPHASSA